MVPCEAKFPMMWFSETSHANSAFYFCFPGEKGLPETREYFGKISSAVDEICIRLF